MSINMKHILRKLHIGGSLDGRGHHTGRVLEQQQQQDGGGGAGAPSSSSSHGISGWLRQGLHGGGGGAGTRSRLDSPRNNSAPDTPLPHPPSSSSALPIVEEEEDDNDTTMDFKFYEEEFQVQLALALSASNDDIRNDPDSVQIRATKRISLGRPPSPGNTPNEYFSHRYWAYNVLDYDEKVVDGFYDVYGVLSDFGASEKMPSLVDLQGAVVTDNLGYDVVLVKRTLDPELVQLEQAALRLSVDNESGDVGRQQISVIQKLANLVVGHMGGPVMDANLMLRKWQKRSYELRSSLNSIVLPLGCLRIGLSRHRALLFKVLADHARISCRLVKGSYYTGTDEGAVNIIKLDDEREYILDLMGAPGTLLPVEAGGSFHAAAENMYFPPQTEDRNSTQEKVADVSVLVKEDYAGQLDNRTCEYKEEYLQSESMTDDMFGSFGSWPRGGSPDSGTNIMTENSQHTDIDERQIQGQTLTAHGMETLCPKDDNVLKDVAEWEIPWAEIVIGERIGLGSYGEVYHGDWHGKEVAVKKFLDQDLSGDALDEFRSEVRIMCRMQHPNVVLFMGAVTRPPNLSIITEYLPRGSLFRLIHRPNNGLDEACRLKMALDVAKGMNYLHTSSPTIVHRDLKSPNLLVDRDWLVKVCDFGLSRMKHHTFLSSKSTAGTPEWMAPEVLRNEPSNEKCDVYSFGVILWELATLQQPWGKMNPMQVVGAVGFQNRHLEIPEYVDPLVSRVIQECWRSEPGLRPSFAQIILALEPLQRLT